MTKAPTTPCRMSAGLDPFGNDEQTGMIFTTNNGAESSEDPQLAQPYPHDP